MSLKSKSELEIFTKAKELCDYILTITEKSPKKFRFTLTSRMINTSLEIVEILYGANEIYLSGGKDRTAVKERLNAQHLAITKLKILDFLAKTAMQHGCILEKQYDIMADLMTSCRNLAGAWINADRRRFGQEFRM